MAHGPILLIGGYGATGARVTRALRRRNPDLHIWIGGRTPEKARALADSIGGAEGVAIDLAQPDLGLGDADIRAVGLIAHDPTLNAMNFAASRRAGFLTLTGGAFEFGVDAIPGLSAGRKSPVVFAGHWFAGAVTTLAILLAREFTRIDEIEIGIVIDRGGDQAGAGPATVADFKRISANAPSALERLDGRYVWTPNEAARGKLKRADGVEIDGVGSVSCDVLSIGAATGARNIRILEGWGTSSARARGEESHDEINIAITGFGLDGRALMKKQSISCPRSQTSFTVVMATILVERLSSTAASVLPPGFYLAEHALDAFTAAAELKAAGCEFVTLA